MRSNRRAIDAERLTIRMHGDRSLIRKLTAIGARAENVAPAWPEVAEMIGEEVGRNFDTQGAYFGVPWRPLAASTAAAKEGPAPLVETGRLRRLLTRRRLPIMRITGNSMSVGTHDRIARFQHGGTHRNGRPHIPARTLIKATPTMRRQAARILGKYVMTGQP